MGDPENPLLGPAARPVAPSGGSRPGDSQGRGWRIAGRLFRDGLLLLVILAMGLPFLVAEIGERSVDPRQEELVRAARHAALVEQDWLGNSLTSKVVQVESLPDGGVHVRQRFYTFFGLPWGWYEADVASDGTVSALATGLSMAR